METMISGNKLYIIPENNHETESLYNLGFTDEDKCLLLRAENAKYPDGKKSGWIGHLVTEDNPHKCSTISASKLYASLKRIVSYFDEPRVGLRLPALEEQAKGQHENTMFGEARKLLKDYETANMKKLPQLFQDELRDEVSETALHGELFKKMGEDSNNLMYTLWKKAQK